MVQGQYLSNSPQSWWASALPVHSAIGGGTFLEYHRWAGHRHLRGLYHLALHSTNIHSSNHHTANSYTAKTTLYRDRGIAQWYGIGFATVKTWVKKKYQLPYSNTVGMVHNLLKTTRIAKQNCGPFLLWPRVDTSGIYDLTTRQYGIGCFMRLRAVFQFSHINVFIIYLDLSSILKNDLNLTVSYHNLRKMRMLNSNHNWDVLFPNGQRFIEHII